MRPSLEGCKMDRWIKFNTRGLLFDCVYWTGAYELVHRRFRWQHDDYRNFKLNAQQKLLEDLGGR